MFMEKVDRGLPAQDMRKQLFALRGPDGMWVHFSLTKDTETGDWRMTDVRAWRWTPTAERLGRALKLHPSLKQFTVVALERQPK